jgi:hypothetical protein
VDAILWARYSTRPICRDRSFDQRLPARKSSLMAVVEITKNY